MMLGGNDCKLISGRFKTSIGYCVFTLHLLCGSNSSIFEVSQVPTGRLLEENVKIRNI